MKYIAVLVFIFTGFTQAVSQSAGMESPLIYLYSLTPVQAFQLKEHPDDQPEPACYTVPYDSFPSLQNYSKTPPPGYYLVVKARFTQLEQTLIQMSLLDARLLNNGHDLRVSVSRKNSGEIVKTANITFGNTSLAFEESSSTYVLNKRVKTGKLKIEAEGETIWLDITGNTNRVTKENREKYSGYIAFSKPRYRTGDTVKLKALILRDGKPLTETMQLRIPKESWGGDDVEDLILKTTLRPVTPGAYVYSFVAGDSMKLDQEYNVEFYRTKGRNENHYSRILYSNFYLEDYQLNQTVYTVKTTRPTYAPGDTVSVLLSGLDFNGLPLFDASAEISIFPRAVLHPSADSEELPYQVFHKKINLDPSGETCVCIPPSVFSSSGVNYEAAVYFKNSNGELHTENTAFGIQPQGNDILVKDQDTCLFVRYFVKGKESSAEGTISFLGQDNDSLFSRHITFPYSFLPPVGTSKCYLKTGTTGKTVYFSGSELTVNGYRTHDSICIRVDNPRKIRFYWELTKEGELLSKGTSSEFTYSQKDPGKTGYKLLIHAPWCLHTPTTCYTFLPKDKTLSVELTQPKEIFPGEHSEITVKVTDFDHKPVKDANITLNCINAQFGSRNEPEVPDFNKPTTLKKKEYVFYQSFMNGYYRKESLNTSWIERMHLDTLSYYRFLFPESGFYERFMPLQTSEAQFAPFVVSHGEFLKILFIYVDEKPLYAFVKDPMNTSSTLADKEPWSFIVPEGKHHVCIRTAEQEFHLDQVEFRKGSKLELSFNAQRFPACIFAVKRSTKLNKEEKKILNENLFVFRQVSGSYSGINFFRQGITIRMLHENEAAIFHPGDSIYYKVYTKTKVKTGSFLFIPGKAYSFNDDSVLSRPWVFSGKRLRAYYGEEETPGKIALTQKEMYTSNLHYSYAYGRRDVPDEQNVSDTAQATYLFPYSGKTPLVSLELYRVGSNEARVHPFNSYNAGEDHLIYNIRPGTYRGTFRKANGDYFEKTIILRGGNLHIDRISETNFILSDKTPPASVQCPLYSLTYQSHPLHIAGQLDGAKTLGDITVAVFYRGTRLGAMTSDKAGKFEAEVREPGIYTLLVQGDTLIQSTWIGGLIVTQNYSPEIHIHLNTQSSHSSYHTICNQAFEGTNYSLIQDTLSGQVTSNIAYIPEKTEAPQIDHTFNSFARGEKNWQTFSDQPEFKVNGTSILEEYHRGYSMFHRRKKASFYKSHYNSIFASSVTAKRKFRSTTAGWNYDEVDDGGFSRVQLGKFANAKVLETDPDLGEVVVFAWPGQVRGGTWKEVSSALNDSISGITSTAYSLPLADPASGRSITIRKHFTDGAYWKPNLLSDSSGKVHFSVTFPENLTRWDAYAIAVTADKQSGKAVASSKSFKPLVAQMAAPRFLLQGDTSFVVGKIMNYGKEDIKIHTTFRIDGKLLPEKIQTLSKGGTEKQVVIPTKTDSLKLEYTLQTDGGYSDGEQLILPVLPVGCEEAAGTMYYLTQDTLIHLPIDTTGKMEVTVLGSDLDLLLAKLKTINDYPYFCNEQIASKINALLMEKVIFQKQGKSFQRDRELERLLRKLEKAQNETGSWGWWDDSHSNNLTMTTYIIHVLGKAVHAGCPSPAFLKGLSALTFELPGLQGDELVYAMSVLSENNALPDAARYLDKAGKSSPLSTWSRYALIQIRQALGLPVSVDIGKLLDDKKETALGACYWGTAGIEWFDNSTQLTLLAYRILEKQGEHDKTLEGIRKYFLEHSDRNVFRNTYETASILEAILPSRISAYTNNQEKTVVTLAGASNQTIDHFPYTGSFQSSFPQLNVSKTGSAPVYFSLYHRAWNSAPVKKEDLFAVTTRFETGGKTAAELEFGKAANFIAEVTARKKGDYVMIEIPIPAGCSYQEKKQAFTGPEVHREYLKDKVIIFCETLPAGTWRFEVALQPRFSGSYSLNPATVELMYFPFLFGRTGIKKINIE